MQNILVIGGAGYVGAVLVPKLLDQGYAVRVLDLMLFGEDVLPQHPKLEVVKGDMRDKDVLARRQPWHGRRDPARLHLERSELRAGSRAVASRSTSTGSSRPWRSPASSGCAPVRLRLDLERLRRQRRARGDRGPSAGPAHRLQQVQGPHRAARPQVPDGRLHAGDHPAGHGLRLLATAAAGPDGEHPDGQGGDHEGGHGVRRQPEAPEHPRRGHLRAVHRPADPPEGADQRQDVQRGVREPHRGAAGRASCGTRSMREMPELGEIAITTTPSNDLRSYHVSSAKIKRELGWEPKRTIDDAVVGLCAAFKDGRIPMDALERHQVHQRQDRPGGSGLAVQTVTRRADRHRRGRLHRQPHGGSAARPGLSRSRRHRQPLKTRPDLENLSEPHGERATARRFTTSTWRRCRPTRRSSQDADYVFHFGGLGDIVPSIERPLDYTHANITGTLDGAGGGPAGRRQEVRLRRLVVLLRRRSAGADPGGRDDPARVPVRVQQVGRRGSRLPLGHRCTGCRSPRSGCSTSTGRGSGPPASTARCSACSWRRSCTASR